jgi:hypothetical protein
MQQGAKQKSKRQPRCDSACLCSLREQLLPSLLLH